MRLTLNNLGEEWYLNKTDALLEKKRETTNGTLPFATSLELQIFHQYHMNMSHVQKILNKIMDIRHLAQYWPQSTHLV